MTPPRRLIFALFSALPLTVAACAPSGDRARVTAYVDPGSPQTLSGLTLTIRPRDGQAGSLKWARLKDRLADEARSLGAIVVADNETSPAPWVLSVTHGTDGPVMVTHERPVMTGNRWHGPPPFFGDPWENRTFTQVTYVHWLELTLHNAATLGDLDPAEVRPVNQIRVEQEGEASNERDTLAVLARTAIWTFPGQEGPSSVIRVPPPSR